MTNKMLSMTDAHEYMREAYDWDISLATFRKMAEPDAEGKRALPFFHPTARSRRVYTTSALLDEFVRTREEEGRQAMTIRAA